MVVGVACFVFSEKKHKNIDSSGCRRTYLTGEAYKL